MVRFAHDILQRMQVITKELEVRLGPGTADLALRVGIHSGAVTAGILRGQKARFQLFGDAMNTCSRLESSSKPGRIHISQATADLLVKAGKGHWIQKRAEPVAAKGKGKMVTYWVISGSDRKDGESTTSGSSTCRTSSEDDSPGSTRKKQPKHVRETREKVEQLQLPSSIEGDMRDRISRLVEWNVEILLPFIRQIGARRIAKAKCQSYKSKAADILEKPSLWERGERKPLDEVQEIVALPEFDQAIANQNLEAHLDKVEITSETVHQLRTFIATIATMYQANNAFHNFEHASHVTMVRIPGVQWVQLKEHAAALSHPHLFSFTVCHQALVAHCGSHGYGRLFC